MSTSTVVMATLGDQVRWATDSLTPLWWASQHGVLEERVMHLDGTGMPVLVRDRKTHKNIGSGKRLGTLWGYVGGETALFLYCSTGLIEELLHAVSRAAE